MLVPHPWGEGAQGHTAHVRTGGGLQTRPTTQFASSPAGARGPGRGAGVPGCQGRSGRQAEDGAQGGWPAALQAGCCPGFKRRGLHHRWGGSRLCAGCFCSSGLLVLREITLLHTCH